MSRLRSFAVSTSERFVRRRSARRVPRLLVPLNQQDEYNRKKVYRQSRSHDCLDVLDNEDLEPVAGLGLPRRVPINDGSSDRCGLSLTRSLDDLSQLDQQPAFLMPPSSGRSTPSMASEEDEREERAERLSADAPPTNDYEVNTQAEVASRVTEQSDGQRFGDIEMVAGMADRLSPSYWKGEVTPDWTMRLFRDGDRERVITIPPLSMLLLEEMFIKVNEMEQTAVIEEKPGENPEEERPQENLAVNTIL